MVDKKFILNMRGKDFVLVAGLLDLAHHQGLVAIDTQVMAELCQPEDGRWVVRAVGKFRSGEGEIAEWSAHGDADPSNSQMKGAELRHAETRAIARMLRFATNVAMTAFEELGPDSDAPDGHNGHQRPAQGQRARHDPTDHAERRAAQEAAQEAPSAMCSVCGEPVTPAVAAASRKKFEGVVLCVADGKERLALAREPSAQLQGA